MSIYNLISFCGIFILIGFAHVASMAIFVGGISALAPVRRQALSLKLPSGLF